jgi:hypothetical protein
MDALLGLLQSMLVLLFLAGGGYKLFGSAEMASQMHALPRLGWAVVGLYEMLGAILLAVPALAKWLQPMVPLVAIALAVESLGLAVIYANHSLVMTSTNPLPWSIGIAVLSVLLAWGRHARTPRA